MEAKYHHKYAPNSRETIRRQTIHQFEQARLIDRNPDDPKRPTNSGKTVYRLTDKVTAILRLFATPQFEIAVQQFKQELGSLKEAYGASRKTTDIVFNIPYGNKLFDVRLSPGKHNALQVQVVTKMIPEFIPDAQVIYLGDTARKHIVYDESASSVHNIPITEHDKLPDIILHSQSKNCLFLVEAVTSHGPVSPKRRFELEKMMAQSPTRRVYITAFPDGKTFRRYASQISWETEVWIADEPQHMIHFNGSKFL